jgi:CRP-like cAMP-binding protein
MATVSTSHPEPGTIDRVFAGRGWLAGQPALFRAQMLALGMVMDVPAGGTVFREGEPASGLYGIVAGGIGVEGAHEFQAPLLGHVHRAGDWFGFRGPLEAGRRLWTFRATEPSRLVLVPNSRLLPLMRTDPSVAIRVAQLAEQGNQLAAWAVRDLLTPDAARRLASVLLRVLGMGEVTPDDPQGFWLAHRELGEMSNLSRHHVGRKLKDFEASGWIGCGYNRIRLLDADGLAAFAYGDGED